MQLALVGAVFFVAVTLFVMSATTLWWMLHAWRTPDTLVSTGYAVLPDAPELSFSLLVPARHEQAVLATTLERLVRVQHPAVEILAIVGHDDPETEAVARSVASRHPAQVRVVIDHHVPKNKPKALMTALPECRGEIVGVFDAEDDVEHRLLRFVDAAFRRTVVMVSFPAALAGAARVHPPWRQHRFRPCRRSAGSRWLGHRVPRRGLRAGRAPVRGRCADGRCLRPAHRHA